MKLGDIKDVVILAALGYGVYWVIKNFPKLPSAADIGRVATEAKNLIMTSPVTPLGQIRLTDGTVIAVNDVVNAGGVVDSSGGFVWNGTHYTILGLGPDGVYEVM